MLCGYTRRHRTRWTTPAPADLDDEEERDHDEDGFGEPMFDEADPPGPEPDGEDDSAEATEVRRPRFGTPSPDPDDRIYPGMDELDPTFEERREEEEVREACERGEHIPGKTAVIVFGDRREVIPFEKMRAAREVGAFVLQW